MTDPTPTTPVTIRDQLHILSENLRGSSNHTLSTIWTKLDTLETSIDELKAQMTLLQEGLGASPYQALTLTTTRGLLYAILGRLTTLALGIAPEVGTPEYVSSGETIIDGRRYALFPNAISGVTIDTTRTELTRSDWTGWQYFIQTTDPAPWANGIPTVAGIWAPFGPFTTWNFSTAAQYSITVYLRNNNAVPIEPYVLWSGIDAEPGMPLYGAAFAPAYYSVEIPVWADRIQLNYAGTNCAGTFVWLNNAEENIGTITGSCHNTILTPPVGAKYLLQNSGSNIVRATGTVWALAPGVDPVP